MKLKGWDRDRSVCLAAPLTPSAALSPLAVSCAAPSPSPAPEIPVTRPHFHRKAQRGGALLLTPRQGEDPSKSRIRCLHAKRALQKGRPNQNLSPQGYIHTARWTLRCDPWPLWIPPDSDWLSRKVLLSIHGSPCYTPPLIGRAL